MLNKVLPVVAVCFGFFSIAGVQCLPGPALAAPDVEYPADLVDGKGVPANFYLVASGQDGVLLRELVRDAGGRVLAEMPPDLVLASFASSGDALFLGQDFRVRSISPLADKAGQWSVDEMDRDFLTGMRLALSDRTISVKKPPLVNDAMHRDRVTGYDVPFQAPVTPPDGLGELEILQADNVPILPAWPMKNIVAVTIIMPESDGSIDTNRENWTTSLETTVYNEITTGLTWWPEKGSAYGVDLEFKFYSYRPSQQSTVLTGYEPITHNSDDEGLWIGDVMNNLGYTGYYTQAVDSFNAYMKSYAGADSAITIFVVNSANDSNGEFPDGYFAYAHWGGPLIVMTTDNSSYGLSMMSEVVVHEMGHAFYAVDEYYSPGYATCSCGDGYNGCENRNCAAGCGMDVPCMMRYNEDALCADTVCHIGWVCQCTSGTCCDGCGYRPGSHICRKSAGDCDITEFCTGSSTTCPKDTFRTSSYRCRQSGGDCDVAEYCAGGSAECPADVVIPATTECRASAGVCDVAEKCSGVGGACPANVLLDVTHVCRESGGDCDSAETCTGKSAACPADNVSGTGSICRESIGVCDAPEYCDAGTGECPPDEPASSTTVCRAAAGACDAPEYCTGEGGECPPDNFQRADFVCRPPVGACDAPETCDGNSAKCPVDYIKGKGAECRAASGACDAVEVCGGASTKCPADYIYGAGIMCRAPETDCDIAEFCTGAGTKCPANAMYATGHSCDDGQFFTSNDRCAADGACVGIEDTPWWGCSASGGSGPASSRALVLVLLAAGLAVIRFSRGRSSAR